VGDKQHNLDLNLPYGRSKDINKEEKEKQACVCVWIIVVNTWVVFIRKIIWYIYVPSEVEKNEEMAYHHIQRVKEYQSSQFCNYM
jgi:hypothetical protein